MSLEFDDLNDLNAAINRFDHEVNLLEQYRNILDDIAIVSKTSPTGRISYVNEKFCQVSGYTADELIGEKHNIVRHPDMPQSAFESMWKTLTQKKVWRGVVKNRRKDGSAYYLESNIYPILDPNNQVQEYISARFEVTELVLKSLITDLHEARTFHLSWIHKIHCLYNCLIGNTQEESATESLHKEFSIGELIDKYQENGLYLPGIQSFIEGYQKLDQIAIQVFSQVAIEPSASDQTFLTLMNQSEMLLDQLETLEQQIKHELREYQSSAL